MSTDDKSKIIDTIRKCFALGDKTRNPSEAEAENAIRHAKRLMAAYNLTMADVVEKTGELPDKIVEEHTTPRSEPPFWETRISRVCDHLFGTKSFLSDKAVYGPDGKTFRSWHRIVVFCGYAPDVALALEVYKLLKMELLVLARDFERRDRANPAPDYNYDSGEETTFDWAGATPAQIRTRKFKYLEGVVRTLENRSWTDWDAAKTAQEKRTRDLVIVPKQAKVDAWVKEHHDLHSIARRSSELHSGAVDAGVQDGKSVNLNFKNKVSTDAKGNKLSLGYNKGGSK